MSKHSLETMLPHRVQPVWAIYSRLGYAPDCYPHRHAIPDYEQGIRDTIIGAIRAEAGIPAVSEAAA